MKRNVLMVYPSIPSTYWSFDHAMPFVGKRSLLPPLGLMTVAALLGPGYVPRLVDMNVEPLTDTDLRRADLVFISAMIVQSTSFAEVVSRAAALGKTVVAGGPYPISSHESIEGVDHFVLDEAELTLPAFLSDFESGCARRIYRAEGRADITQTPPPRFDLIDVDAYDSMALQTTRGCPFECEFCDIIEMFGRTPRTKTPAQVLGELDAVWATGFRGSLFVVDDNFVGNRAKIRVLLRAIGSWQRAHGHPYTLTTEASVDMAADDELLGLMVEAGFVTAFVGIETPDVATLAFTGKAQNTRRSLADDVRAIQTRGIEVAAGFILGFDTDDAGVFDRQIQFVQEAGIPLAMVGLLTALPNTALHRRLAREGRLRGETSGNNTHTLEMNFVPRLPMETLVTGYKRVLHELYTPRRYFQRCATLIDRLPDPTLRGAPIGARELRALALSLLRQSFSPYGWTYLGFLSRVLLRSPRRFPMAVSLAVKGHHFFMITDEIPRAEGFERLLRDLETTLERRVRRALAQRRRRPAVALEARIGTHLRTLGARYGELGEGMQRHVERAFERFTESCVAWLGILRRRRTSSTPTV